jgi:MFS family permease
MASISDIRLQVWILGMYNIPYSPQSLGSLRDTGADSDPGLIRATEAIAWSSIFPYAYYMIRSFEVPEHEVAFYASALVGVFTFGEFLTGVVWARVSDRIGRKPTLMLGTFCALVSALSFGCSGSVAAAIASRAFGGLFNPNVGLVQTCAGELARKEQQGKHGRAGGCCCVKRP